MCDFHPEFLLDGLLDFEKPRIAILQYLSRLKINEMVVLPELVGTLVLGAVVPELVLDHQVGVEQQLNGIVQGGAADTVFVVLHLVVQLFDVEMAIRGVDLMKDGESLRGFPKIVLVKVFGEYLPDCQYDGFVVFFHVLGTKRDVQLF